MAWLGRPPSTPTSATTHKFSSVLASNSTAQAFTHSALEFAPLGCVRQFISQHPNPPPPPLPTRLRMALDVAAGVAYLHHRGVQHCDMSCRNLFLFDGFRVKLGDFGASLLQGRDDFTPTFCEESQYELPLRGRRFDDRPPVQRELFALGSAIYEITAWERPFQGLENKEVEARYAREEFPCLEGNVAGPVIEKCWKEEFESASDVLEALTGCIQSVASFPEFDQVQQGDAPSDKDSPAINTAKASSL